MSNAYSVLSHSSDGCIVVRTAKTKYIYAGASARDVSKILSNQKYKAYSRGWRILRALRLLQRLEVNPV